MTRRKPRRTATVRSAQRARRTQRAQREERNAFHSPFLTSTAFLCALCVLCALRDYLTFVLRVFAPSRFVRDPPLTPPSPPSTGEREEAGSSRTRWRRGRTGSGSCSFPTTRATTRRRGWRRSGRR